MIQNSFANAKLISLRKIHVLVFTDINRPEKVYFNFVEGLKKPISLRIVRQTSMNNTYFFELELPFDYPFGENCTILTNEFGAISIDISHSTSFKEFDELFNYDGFLGHKYSKEETSFYLWAPISTSVVLNIQDDNGNFVKYGLKRQDKGVYYISLKGDYLNHLYFYEVVNGGVTRSTPDPWSYGASLDSIYSAVIDIDSIKNKIKIPTTKLEKASDAIIYEMHIRDFTENVESNVVNKGKYLGVIEEGRTSIYGDKVSLDYLKDLGITHLQIQPILDFNLKDNYNIKTEYNWGYDPIHMFSIEGSYATHPEIPSNRIEEFRMMVDKLHECNIKVVVDVVYNHLYEYLDVAMEKVVPNYFFRKMPNGRQAMASGCGNDFASERYMGRKAIVDSCHMLFDIYDIDGIRFDLMGLMDIDTLLAIEKDVKSIKEDAILYGEGWNMGNELKDDQKGSQENAFKLRNYGFFNDSFRDIIKGPTFMDKLHVKGYINGDNNYALGAQFALLGSTCNHTYPLKYENINQSINYVECHDNNTLFDKLSVSNANEDKETLLDRVKLANTLVMLSFGVPFFHMGQEIGLSKHGLDNTYITPGVNNFNYKKMHKRYNMVTYFKELVSLRKNEFSFLSKYERCKEIKELVSFDILHNGLMVMKFDNKLDSPYKDLKVIINIYNKAINLELDDYHHVLFSKGGKNKDVLAIKNALIAPISVSILYKK